MRIEPLEGRVEVAAALHGVDVAVLRRRDADRGWAVRWLAYRGREPVGVVTAWERPDARTFLTFATTTPEAYRPLADAASEALRRPLHAAVDAGDPAADRLRAGGFVVEVTSHRFRVRFDAVREAMRRTPSSTGLAVRTALDVDEDRLFALDNAIRDDVPGTNGWRGNRGWFRAELAESPPFEPAAYLVAIDRTTGDPAGLVRFWRNPSEPRLGLIGVTRRYRGSPVARVLLTRAVAAASTWGHATFVTETGTSNVAVHRALVRAGGVPIGGHLQLRRP